MIKEELIKKIIDEDILRTREIIDAFKTIDRADFVQSEYLSEAYGDCPLPIGQGQTISQPSTVAFMLELLQPKKGEKVLDVGSGSGWTTALLAEIVGPTGKVWGVELVSDLVKFGQENLAKYNFSWAEILQSPSVGFGQAKVGLPSEAPFDKILVSASAEELPHGLVDQLREGGRMVIPIGNSVFKIDKISAKEIKQEEFSGFVFVPLK